MKKIFFMVFAAVGLMTLVSCSDSDFDKWYADPSKTTTVGVPQVFTGILDAGNGWMNPTLYENSPERFLPQMPADHPYIKLYNERKMILCCGQGAWEEDSLRTLKYLESVFHEKGIHAWCDFWGYDVNHDWPWWYKQMRYFLPFMLSNQ